MAHNLNKFDGGGEQHTDVEQFDVEVQAGKDVVEVEITLRENY